MLFIVKTELSLSEVNPLSFQKLRYFSVSICVWKNPHYICSSHTSFLSSSFPKMKQKSIFLLLLRKGNRVILTVFFPLFFLSHLITYLNHSSFPSFLHQTFIQLLQSSKNWFITFEGSHVITNLPIPISTQ